MADEPSTQEMGGDTGGQPDVTEQQSKKHRIIRPTGPSTLGVRQNSDSTYVHTRVQHVDARGAAVDAGLALVAGAGPAAYAAKRYMSRRSTAGDGDSRADAVYSAMGPTAGWHGVGSSAANLINNGSNPNDKSISVDLDNPFEAGEDWNSRARKVNAAAQEQGYDVASSQTQATVNSLLGNGAIRQAAERVAGKRNIQALTGNGSTNAVTGRQLKAEARADVKQAKREARHARAQQIAANLKAAGPGGSKEDWEAAKAANKAASLASKEARGKQADFKAATNATGLRGVANRGLGVLGDKIGKPMGQWAGAMGLRGANWARGKALGLANSAAQRAVQAAAAIANKVMRLAKRATAIAKNIVHTIVFLFTPPQVIVVAIVFALIFTMLNIITIKQTFGPSDIDCSQVSDSDSSSDSSDGSDGGGAPSNSVEAWVKKYGQYAYDTGIKYGIPYEAILAQGAVESGWNSSTLSSKYHNFFGIKAYPAWKGETVTMGTREETSSGGSYNINSAFIAPSDEKTGWEEYGKFIRKNSIYNKALQYPNDYKQYIKEIKAAGYATDNSYVETITSVADDMAEYIKQNNLFAPSSDTSRYVPEMGKPDPNGGASLDENGESTADNGSSSANGDTACINGKDSSGATGDIGGAKECDQGKCGFDWMCDAIGVCKNGDYGNDKSVYAHGEYGYQCVWYAWNRASMVYGTQGWSWVQGNGGDIWANAQGKPGWTVDQTPHAGDIISGHGKPFAGSTHVAFVEKVADDPSGWKIYISEGNYAPVEGNGGFHGYHTRWLTKDQALTGDNHFLRHDSWKAKQDAAAAK